MAQLIDRNSVPSGKTELDVFSVPTTQVAVKCGFWHEVYPQNTLTDDGPYEFHIPSDPHFLDLSKNYIYLQLRITQQNGQPLRWDPDGADAAAQHAEHKVGPITLLGKTFFKQVKLFLGSKLAYDSGDSYAYRSFIETDLNFDEHYKAQFLQAAGYKADAPTDHLEAEDENTGWTERCTWFQSVNGRSTVVEFMAPLHVDLFHQEKYLINKIDVRLELHRNSNPFLLMSASQNASFSLRVDDMKWLVKKVDPVESVVLALEQVLQRTTVKYPVRRVQLKTLQLEAGRRDTPTSTLFNGQIPRRLVICLVDNDAFHGSYKKTPFNFKHYHATSIQITAGGVNYPPNPLRMDFDRNHVVRPYVQMYEALGLASTRKTNWLDPDDFSHGSAYYVFDLSPDSSDDAHWELVRDGATTVAMTFKEGIPAGGVKLLALAEFDNLITIDRFRNVYFDYAP
jgi:ribonucleoside-diphosphate reductase beta chain